MKTAARIRIVAWSVVAVVLVAFLVKGLQGDFSFKGFGFNIGGYHYDEAGNYTAGDGGFDKREVTNIKVNWVAGSVTVKEYDGDRVTFSEEGGDSLSDKEKLHYYLKGDTLLIQFCESNKMNLFGSSNSKKLTVQVPKGHGLGDIQVEAASANVNMSGLTAKSLRVDVASGRIDVAKSDVANELRLENVSGTTAVEDTKAQKVNCNTVSGKTEVAGDFVDVDLESVSGSIKVQTKDRVEKVDCDTVSGSITLTIPDLKGFTARHDSVSGSFKCDFATTSEKKQAVYKDGSAEFDFETVSGSTSILRAS